MEFQMKPNFDIEKNRWEVEILGEIDIYNAQNVKDYLANLVQEHAADIYMDCSNLEYIDSTGLGALVAIVKKVRSFDCNIHLLNVKSNVYKIFHITNLDKVFIIEGDNHEL